MVQIHNTLVTTENPNLNPGFDLQINVLQKRCTSGLLSYWLLNTSLHPLILRSLYTLAQICCGLVHPLCATSLSLFRSARISWNTFNPVVANRAIIWLLINRFTQIYSQIHFIYLIHHSSFPMSNCLNQGIWGVLSELADLSSPFCCY